MSVFEFLSSTSSYGMSEIKSLSSTSCCRTVYWSGCKSELLGFGHPMQAVSSEYGSGTSCRSPNASSCIAPSSSSLNAVAAKWNSLTHLKKLKLSLKPGQIDSVGIIERIRSWFIEIDPAVNVQRTDKENTYIIAFKNPDDAHVAFTKLRDVGFSVLKIHPRPKPNSPKPHKCLTKLEVRKGKSFKTDFVT